MLSHFMNDAPVHLRLSGYEEKTVLRLRGWRENIREESGLRGTL